MSRESRLLLILSLICLLIRLLLLQQYASRNPFHSYPILDSAVYLDWADSIVEKKAFFVEEYHQPPGYAFFLGSVFKLFGRNYFLILFLQSLMIGVSAVLVFYCTKAIFDAASGWVALSLFSLCGPIVFYSMKVLPETLYTTLLIASFYFLLLYKKTSQLRKLLLCGLWMGMAIETRSNGAVCLLPCLGAILATESGWYRRAAAVGIFSLGVAVSVVPVLIRNVAVAGVWSPVSSNWGENFFFANNASATGTFSSPVPQMGKNLELQMRKVREEAVRLTSRPLTSFESQRFWFSQGIDFIRSQPVKWVELELRKLQKILWRHEASNMYFYELETEHFQPALRVLFVGYGLLVPIFFAGLAATPRSFATLTLLTFIVVQILLLLVFWIELRFLLPIMPFLIMVGGNVIHLRFDFWKRRECLVLPAVIGILFCIVTNLILQTGTGGKESWYTNVSTALFQLGRNQEGLEMASRAIQINPQYADAWVNLGAGFAATGNKRAARKAWTNSLRLDPNNFQAFRNMAISYENDDPGQALRWWNQALRAAIAENDSSDEISAVRRKITEMQERIEP